MSHLQLFPMPNLEDVRGHLLDQDVIWVDGGSVANLVAVWRVHGLDAILHEAWQAGVVLSGVSAGSICWHTGGSTDSFGLKLRAFTDGLGWLPYSNGVHYDGEEQRRPTMHELIGNGTLPDGYATDDGAGLVYRGTELVEVVARPRGTAGVRVEARARWKGHRDTAAHATAPTAACVTPRRSWSCGWNETGATRKRQPQLQDRRETDQLGSITVR
jgi:peptidase E